MLYRKSLDERKPPLCCLCVAACEERVNPQTEREKIGHFHIYSSVRSRAVCRESERERKGGREGRGLQPQELWGFTSLPLSLFYLWTHSQAYTLLRLHGHTGERQTEGGRERGEEKKVRRQRKDVLSFTTNTQKKKSICLSSVWMSWMQQTKLCLRTNRQSS